MASGDSFGAAVPLNKDAFGPPVPVSTNRPGFVTGLRESAGIPTWAEATAWAHRVWKDPAAAAKRGGREAVELAGFIVNHPGQFVWQMTNVPQMHRAWKQGNYREMLGLLAGTGAQLLPLAGEESIAARSIRGLRAGLAGETAEGLKAAEAARVAARAVRVTEPVERITLAEKPGRHPVARMVQSTLQQTPFVGKPFEQLAGERAGLVRQFGRAVGTEAQQEQTVARSLYQGIEDALGDKAVLFRQAQDDRSRLWSEYGVLRRRGKLRDAAQVVQAIKQRDNEIDGLLKDTTLQEAYRAANSHSMRQHALNDLFLTVNNSMSDLAEEERLPGRYAPPRPVRGRTLLAKLAQMERTPFGNRLVAAVGESRAKQIKNVASDLARLQSNGRLSYWLLRIGGEATLGVLAGTIGYKEIGGPAGFVVGMGVGAIGARVMSEAVVRMGRTDVLEGFLRSANAGDLAQADRYAKQIAQFGSQQLLKEAKARASAVTPAPTPQEIERQVKEVLAEGTDPDVFAGQERAKQSLSQSFATRRSEAAETVLTDRFRRAKMLRFLSGRADPRRLRRFPQMLAEIERETGINISDEGSIDQAREVLKQMLSARTQ